MDSERGVDRRRLLRWGGLTAGVAAGAPLVGALPGRAEPLDRDLPPDTRPGGAYDRYVAGLAAQDRFSGVVLLSYRGRTVLSRAYGMADKERGIRNHEGVAVNLSSGIQPFCSVAILRLAQRGALTLADPVGAHLKGFAPDVAEKVTIHHLLTGTSGLSDTEPDLRRVFHSRDEVHAYYEAWTRQAKPVAPPGAASQGHTAGAGAGLAIAAQIVEALTGTTYWDYVHDQIFARCGMTGSGFFTRPQWRTDAHIAHSYMLQADGGRVDAVRHLDKGSIAASIAGKNPARSFVGYAADGGFATAPDLVRFAHALDDGTVLDGPYADLLAGAKIPHGVSFEAYTMPVKIIDGGWLIGRGGGSAGSTTNWNIYRGTGWVGVVLSNYDDVPIQEILQRETQAVTGSR